MTFSFCGLWFSALAGQGKRIAVIAVFTVSALTLQWRVSALKPVSDFKNQ
jgi:hypothetical protein